MSSRLDNLNIVSPPKEASNEFDLSGIDSNELSKQLEMWTNVSFAEDNAYTGFEDKEFFNEKNNQKLNKRQSDYPYLLENKFASFPDASSGHAPPMPDPNALYAADGSQLLFPDLSFGNVYHNNQQQQQNVASSAATLPASTVPSTSASTPAQLVTPAQSTASEETAPTKKRRANKRSSNSTKHSAGDSAEPSPDAEGSPDESKKDHERELIEEDRRRRNTLASARFRVKKKQREAALAQHAQELESKVSELEKTIDSLRTENTWLRGLITESTLNKKRTIENVEASSD